MTRSRIVFKRGSLRPAQFVFAGALIVRLVALSRLASSPLLKASGSDMLFYDEWARRILNGHFSTDGAFYGLPLYAWWLAAIYTICGAGAFIPLLCQALVDAATAVLIYKTTIAISRDDLMSRIAGVMAALGWIFFVPAAAYAASLMPATFGVCVVWFVVWQIAGREVAFGTSRFFLLALLIGITAMAVSNVLIAALLLLAASFRCPTWTKSALAAASIAAGIAIGTSPCWIHNYFIARDPAFLSAHSGVNFWVGNNAEATGYPHLPGMHSDQAQMLSDSIRIAETAAGRVLKRSEVSAYWSSQARSYIVRQPLSWLQLLWRKFANFWNAFEYDDVGVIEQLRRAHVIFPGLHFGLIAAFGLPGMFLAWRRVPRCGMVVGAILLSVAAVLALFVTERYRLVAVPGLLLFAAVGLVEFANALVVWNRLTAGLYIMAIAACAALVSVPRNDRSLWALSSYNRGREALNAGDFKAANAALSRAYAYVPDHAETNFALGNLRLAEGNRTAAEHFYIRTLTLDSRHKGALTNLGVLALEGNDLPAAETRFRQALTYAPNDAKAHFLLARVLFERGDRDEAASEVRRALALSPAQSEFIALRDQIEATTR